MTEHDDRNPQDQGRPESVTWSGSQEASGQPGWGGTREWGSTPSWGGPPGAATTGAQPSWGSPAPARPGYPTSGGYPYHPAPAAGQPPGGQPPAWTPPGGPGAPGPGGFGGPGGPGGPGAGDLGGYGAAGSSRPGGRGMPVLLVAALLVIAALGGGVIGAWTYSQAQGGSSDTAGGTTVVDAPQLDYTSLASIASEVSPSVVQIRAGEGSGSGVVMSEDGYILTNAHVVAPASGDEVSVRLSTGDTASATIVGADARSDIAVVRVEDVSGLTPVPFGDSEQVLVGDTVLAIGSPLGFQGSVTQGIVSALDRTLPVGSGTEQARSLSGLLQTDASINPGNSGGPLVNLDGEVVGINTAIATDGQTNGFIGLGFAVPSNRAIDVADQLIAGEEVRHAFLGVFAGSVETGGAIITEVVPGSPADQAGLREGDIVVAVDGETVSDSSDLVGRVQSAAPGDTLAMEIERSGTTQTVQVTLAEVED